MIREFFLSKIYCIRKMLSPVYSGRQPRIDESMLARNILHIYSKEVN